MGESGYIIPKFATIAETRQAIENALLDARQVLAKDVTKLREAQDRLVKFRLRNEPAVSSITNAFPELDQRVEETAKQVIRLENCLEKLRAIPVNDNTPQNAIRSP